MMSPGSCAAPGPMPWRLGLFFGALVLALLLQGCGTPYATMRNSQGEEVMLLGHDPVAYFTVGKPIYGDPAIRRLTRMRLPR